MSWFVSHLPLVQIKYLFSVLLLPFSICAFAIFSNCLFSQISHLIKAKIFIQIFISCYRQSAMYSSDWPAIIAISSIADNRRLHTLTNTDPPNHRLDCSFFLPLIFFCCCWKNVDGGHSEDFVIVFQFDRTDCNDADISSPDCFRN